MSYKNLKKKNILLSPLDWGLGHAARCVPIIKEISNLGHQVILAGSGLSLKLLQDEFPNLDSVDFPNYPITYPEDTSMNWHFMKQFYSMNAFIRHEHKMLELLIEDLNLHCIISDNRYGLYTKKIPSVLITHQLQPNIPTLKNIVQPYVNRLINRFDEVWVPDYSGSQKFAGNLSQATDSIKKPVHYIGPLSRFKKATLKNQKKYCVAAILSGPEPHRSKFEKIIIEQLNKLEGNHILVSGSNLKNDSYSSNIKHIAMADSKTLESIFNDSDYIISRSGYSSIMDYKKLGISALLVPTPSQPEQEYLASYHVELGQFVVQTEDGLNIQDAVIELKKKKQTEGQLASSYFSEIVKKFLD